MVKRVAVISLIAVVLAIALAFLIFGFFNSGNNEAGVSTQGTTSPGTDSNQEGTNSGNIESGDSGNIKEFDLIARQWEFMPSIITVNQGDRVKLNIQSIDVEHGIALPTFGVSERLSPGETVFVEFIADRKGEFTFFCNVLCGAGHSEMKGKLIVQ